MPAHILSTRKSFESFENLHLLFSSICLPNQESRVITALLQKPSKHRKFRDAYEKFTEEAREHITANDATQIRENLKDSIDKLFWKRRESTHTLLRSLGDQYRADSVGKIRRDAKDLCNSFGEVDKPPAYIN